MQQPFSLCIFVADGDPDGLCIVERSNWVGRALVFPRAAWAQPSVSTRPELQHTGVYLLPGPREDGEGDGLYIGEGDQIKPRLATHHSCKDQKDFWTRPICFVSMGQGLNKAHVQFLEANLIRLAKQAERVPLVRDGLLTQQNQRRWASYRVAGDSPQLDEDSRHLERDSRHLSEDSRHLGPELLSLAEPARLKAKLPTAEMQTLVLRLCDTRWLTTRDLAELLSRDPENLPRRILTGLVNQGLLELRYPGVPNRPDQAYRAVVKSAPRIFH